MDSSPAVCVSCQTPLPADAEFCPHCGTRTPTQISSGGTSSVAVPPDQLEEQQARLQAALGNDYVVERLLGTGGFAAVWAAFDRKLQRRVAIKVLHPDLVATRSLLERFQREAQAVAKLRHPGVIPIYAVGEVEGLAFYIMPLVEGESLRERLGREGSLAPEEARRILREAAAALAVAHKVGIVHRDIKPENLMLEGEDRRVVVMDFGIAKSTAGAGAQTGLTGTGMIIGTPAYMSPEQATGSKEIDVRSDIYSLGVVGFEMLAGRPPFKAATVPELIMEHVATPAPSVTSVRADTPVDLAVAVNRCLEKEPKERWKNAGELSAFLERVSTPVAQAATVSKDLRRFARRGWRPTKRQVFWATLGVAVLVVAALLGVSPARLRVSLLFWTDKVGLTKAAPLPRPEPGRAEISGPPSVWALGGAAAAVTMGGSRLAVVDGRNPVLGLHVFDGQSWQSFRSPEPIGAATQQGNDILLFAGQDGGHMYRWSPAGVVQEDTVPFGARAAWADARSVVLIGYKEGQLAVRDARGWRRMASIRRTQLTSVAGTGANDLAALGFFAAGEDRPDSIVEFDGTSWETLDPRPSGVKERWVYDGVAMLGDRSLVVGGYTGGERSARQPLLLSRGSRGQWRRVRLKTDSTVTVNDIRGIWGTSPDDLIVWSSVCDRCRLAEVRNGVWSESRAMGTGSVLGVVQAGGVLYAVWEDGTVWARRNGRWVFVTEVPSTATTLYAARERPDWSSRLRVGQGLLIYAFWGSRRTQYVSSISGGAFDSVPGGGRGAAVGRRVGWALGGDGVVRRIDCRVGSRCTFARESFAGGLMLAQRTRGGAVLAGAHGLLMRSDELGVWKRMPVPAAMAGESLYSVHESAADRLAVLGSRHLAIFDSLGHGLRVESLPGPARPVSVLLAANGTVALVYGDEVRLEWADGTLAVGCCYAGDYSISASLALSDNRLVFGLSGDVSDPFAKGDLLVVSVDSSRVRYRFVPIERARSRVTALAEEGGNVVVYTTSGRYERSLNDLPFAKAQDQAPAQSRPQ